MFKKKLVVLLSVVALLFVLAPTVSAHEDGGEDDGCGCHEGVREVTGSEKNKVVSNLLKSAEWKVQKKLLTKVEGLKWNGVKDIEVEFNENFEAYLLAIPFKAPTGEAQYVMYALGDFVLLPPGFHPDDMPPSSM